jgi:hypothetical protein
MAAGRPDTVGQALLERVWQALLDSEPSAVVRASATLLGVRHLGYEGQLVEIECTAALPLDPLGHQPHLGSGSTSTTATD